MRLNFKLISLLLVLFFITISFASASDVDDIGTTLDDNIEITNEDGINVEEISTQDVDEINVQEKNTLSATNSKKFKDLNSEIGKSKAGDTIVLDSDYVNGGFSKNGISINKAITIDGKGFTLDAEKKGRIFSISADNVVLKNIIFKNGYMADGAGAISCSLGKKLTLSNCTFRSNSAGAIGGAVFLKNDGHKITGCTFISNTAKKSGGAVRLEGSSTLFEKNVFKNNKVTGSDFLGGAISVLGNRVTIKNNTFENNVAGRDGGAIDVEGTSVGSNGINEIITANTFVNNSAKYGGAISANCQNITISKNSFKNDHVTTSGGLGGAIRIAGAKSNTGKITENTFSGNYAPSGGAIFINGNGTTVSKNIFKNCKATSSSGGTINVRGNSNAVSQNSIDTSSSKGSAGAIYAEGNSFKLTNNNITKASSSASAGAAYILGSSATITGNIFKSNTASTLGGAIQVKGNKATVNSNKFISNTAKSNNGGSIYIESDNAVLKSNDFEGNAAKNGYSLYGKGSKPTISGNNLINIKDQSKELVWLNFKMPAQNKVTKQNTTNTTTNTSTANTTTNATSPSVITDPDDKRLISKIIYEDMETSPVNTNVDGRIGNYFVVRLVDVNNRPLIGLPIKIGFNGKTYDKTSNTDGYAKLQINLKKEEIYTFAICFLGDDNYKGSFEVAKITVNKNNPKANKANENISGTEFSINKTTNRMGTSIQYSDMSTVSVLGVDGRIGKYFTVKLVDATGKALSSLPIKIGFNGKTYDKVTDASGSASLQINLLRPTTYTFAISYLGDSKIQGSFAVAKITVKSQSPKLSFSAKTFKVGAKTKSVSAKLLSANGNPIKNKNLIFTVNGRKYTGTTNSKGVATVKVSLNKKGTYACSVKFDGIVGCNAKSTKANIKIV